MLDMSTVILAAETKQSTKLACLVSPSTTWTTTALRVLLLSTWHINSSLLVSKIALSHLVSKKWRKDLLPWNTTIERSHSMISSPTLENGQNSPRHLSLLKSLEMQEGNTWNCKKIYNLEWNHLQKYIWSFFFTIFGMKVH